MPVLFGVTPLGTKADGEEVFVMPSNALKQKVKEVSQNGIVGLEYVPGLVKNEFFMPSPGDEFYWSELLIAAGGKIAFLDDLDLFNTCTRMMYEAGAAKRKLRHKPTNEMKADAYRRGIEADYVFVIGRGNQMKGKIKETKPDLVVVAEGTANYLLSVMPGFFDSYMVERPVAGTVIARTEVNIGEISTFGLERLDSITRRFNAVTSGRIDLKRRAKPDFTGTWDPEIPARGLFELYIADSQGEEILGEIEDVNGRGTFHGKMSDEHIEFGKNYTGSSSGLNKRPHIYTGTKHENRYEGAFCYGDKRGTFWLSRYTPQESRQEVLTLRQPQGKSRNQ